MEAKHYFVVLAVCLVAVLVYPRLSHASIETSKTGVFSKAFDPTGATQISWQPRAFIYKGFLSDQECDHLINLARDKLMKSMVANDETGESMESEERTSSGMFLSQAEDEIVADIEARIAAWTFLPEENGEPIQILRYEQGQKYEAHIDYLVDKINQIVGGHRLATLLMYLSDVKKGGETIFPNSEAEGSQAKDDNCSDCAKNGYAGNVFVTRASYVLAVKPHKGDALLFFSLHPDSSTDPNSLHASCPVIEQPSGSMSNP